MTVFPAHSSSSWTLWRVDRGDVVDLEQALEAVLADVIVVGGA